MTDINKLVNDLYPKVEYQIGRWTKDHTILSDLVHDVLLKCLENEEKVLELNSSGKLNSWLFFVSRSVFIDHTRRDRYVSLEGDYLPIEESDKHYLPNLKTKGVDDIIIMLDSLDRIYLKTWVDCNFNTSEACRQTGISREKFKNERERILELCKSLKLFY